MSLWPILLCVLCILCVSTACRRAPAPAPPLVAQVSGTLGVAGLAAPVRVVRDTWGVPHISAANRDDLFFAQGFVQAQDRLFQMDLWRRSSQGRLSEVLGPNFIERDAMTRRIQYRGDLAAEWASYGPDAQAIAEAFVRGVNAWVALARERPPEPFVLAGWRPETWAAADLLNRTDAFTESGDALDEIFRARLTAAAGAAGARARLPGDRRIDVPAGLDVSAIPDLVAEMIRRVGTRPFLLGLAAPVAEGTVRGGARTTGDAAITFDHPSPRYLVHLMAPGWNVIGATAPWHPGVVEGHNDQLAWRAEPIDADTQDIYVEKLNPDNPRQVEDAGRWVDIDVRQGRIVVRGRKTPVDFTTETTRHGVIVASDLTRHLAFAIRWSGSEPGTAADLAAPALDRAASAAEFHAALARWKMPARRMIAIETGGTRSAHIAALVPVRRGANGALPVPGWTGTNEWTGWTTFNAIAPPAAQDKRPAGRLILEFVRRHPDRIDALLRATERGAFVDALAEALRERARPPGATVLFAHPLAVTDAARRRFNVWASVPAAAGTDPFAIAFERGDWDRATATNAPGQSESPESAHFADLAALWSAGKPLTLAFTGHAVQEHAETTLTLTPR